MKPKIKLGIIFTFVIFSLLSLSDIQAQNYEQTLKFADKELKQGHYQLALKTYNRLIFFSEKKDNLYDLYVKSGEISFRLKKMELAGYYFDLAYNNTNNKDKKINCLFKKSLSEILSHNYRYALMDLFNIDGEDDIVEKKKNFYIGTCYYGLEKFDKAESYFKKCVSDVRIKDIENVFDNKKLYRPNPKTAKIFSMIIPGAGQVYSGRIKDGVISFGLVTSLYYLLAISTINIDLFSSLVTYLPWIQRYFTGGYERAEKFAIEKRQQNRSYLYNTIIKIIREETLQKK